jgi:hypothetical protein
MQTLRLAAAIAAAVRMQALHVVAGRAAQLAAASTIVFILAVIKASQRDDHSLTVHSGLAVCPLPAAAVLLLG